MSNSLEGIYIEKAKAFRLHFKLSEEEIDELLRDKDLGYSRLESGKRTLTLELAEAYPLIYGIEYCDFKKRNITFPSFEQLPKATQELINKKSASGNKVGLKGTKNKASYVVILIKDFPIGHKVTNSSIIPLLPAPANKDQSIDWGKGLLKGLVKNTGKSNYYVDASGEKRREATYEIIKAVDSETLTKAMQNVDEDWVKEIERKMRDGK